MGRTNESKGNKSGIVNRIFTVVILFDLSLAMTARPGVPFFYANPFFISCGDEAKKC